MNHFKDCMDLQLCRTLVLMTSDPKVEVFLNKDSFKWFWLSILSCCFKVLTIIMTTQLNRKTVPLTLVTFDRRRTGDAQPVFSFPPSFARQFQRERDVWPRTSDHLVMKCLQVLLLTSLSSLKLIKQKLHSGVNLINLLQVYFTSVAIVFIL